MGIIETKIKTAFKMFGQDKNLCKLVKAVANVADYSVQSTTTQIIMYEAIERYCPTD